MTTFNAVGYGGGNGTLAGWQSYNNGDFGYDSVNLPNYFATQAGGNYVNWYSTRSLYLTAISSRPNHFIEVTATLAAGETVGLVFNSAAAMASYHNFVLYENGSWSYEYEGGGMSSAGAGTVAVVAGTPFTLSVDASTSATPVIKFNGSTIVSSTPGNPRSGDYVGISLSAGGKVSLVQIEPGGGGSPSLAIAWTEGDDTWAAAATQTVTATAAWTEDADTWAVSAYTPYVVPPSTRPRFAFPTIQSGGLRRQQAVRSYRATQDVADYFTSLVFGAGSPAAIVAWTEDDDEWSAAATQTTNAAVAWTEDDDTWAAAAGQTLTASVAWTEDDDQWTAATDQTITASAAWTEDDDEWSAAASETLTAAVAWVEDDDDWTVAASNTPTGAVSVAWTEDDDTWAITATATLTAVTAWTEDDDTWAITATNTQTITASITWTEDDDQWSAAASQTTTTIVAWTEDDDTWTITATNFSGGTAPIVTGPRTTARLDTGRTTTALDPPRTTTALDPPRTTKGLT